MTVLEAPSRLRAVRDSGLWDLSAEERVPFDRLVRLAGDQLGVPVAAISVVDAELQRFVAARGVDLVEVPASEGICERVVRGQAPLVIADTRDDPAYGPGSFPVRHGVIAYAGVPLRDATGEVLGALCAMQGHARDWTAADVRLLEELSQIGTAEVLLRATATEAECSRRRASDAEARLALTVEAAPMVLFAFDGDGSLTLCEGSLLAHWGVEPCSAVGHSVLEFYAGDERVLPAIARVLAGEAVELTHEVDGLVVESRYRPIWEAGEVTGVAGVALDVTERRRDRARIAELAYVDRLTRLPNRVALEEHVDGALGATAWAAGRTAALLLVDLDEFQAVNDSLGHAAGDDVLRQVAARLSTVAGSGGYLARQGADEFLLFVDDLGSDPRASAERIAIEVVGALEVPFTTAGVEFFVQAGVGISVFPGHGDRFPELLRGAESALRRAKRGSGARFAVHRRDDEGARRRLTMSARLRRALAEEQFALHYQPLFHLSDGRIAAFEALLRWEDPVHGSVPPLDYIGLAETTGLIVPIGAWVAEEACRQQRKWMAAGLDVGVGFNVSPVQLQRGDFAEQLTVILARTGADPTRMVVEITESTALEEHGVSPELARITALGVRVVIDDFGAGHSSLTRLHGLDVDGLKLDRALLTGVDHDPGACAVVTATLALCHALGIRSVAEGIETEAQRAFLAEGGCELGQGFGLARPMPAEQVTAFLRSPADGVEALPALEPSP